MSGAFDFEHLVGMCRRAHQEMRRRAIRMVDRSLVERNWLFGQYIVEFEHGGAGRGEVYGKQLIERLSAKLKAAEINGCSATNLRKFRQFYLTYSEIQQTPSAESSGRTGIRPTLSVESPVTPAAPGQADALHAAGRFTLGWSHYATLLTLDNAEARRFDLVFYNRLLRCYVLIDLKRGELAHQDLGQMQMYVNYFDLYVKNDDELPTVGIVLCDRKNDAVVELTLPEGANIYASKYQLYLPSKQDLAAQLTSVHRELEERGGTNE